MNLSGRRSPSASSSSTRATAYVDYLLFLDGNAVGVCEAKPAGYAFTSVEVQAKKYVEGLPAALDGARTSRCRSPTSRRAKRRVFINHFDPHAAHAPGLLVPPPRDAAGVADGRHARRVAQAVRAASTPPPTTRSPRRCAPGCGPCRRSSCPACGRTRCRPSPTSRRACSTTGPASLIQMATGSGKTLLAVTDALPPDQVRRRPARAVPRRPRQPRRAGREGVPGLPHARTTTGSSPSCTASSA